MGKHSQREMEYGKIKTQFLGGENEREQVIRKNILLRSVLRVQPKVVVHIGAHLGQDRKNYLAIGAQKIIWAEPNEVCHKALKVMFPNDQVITKPFWDKKNQKLTFYQFEHSEQNSLIPPIQSSYVQTIELITTTMDDEFTDLCASEKPMLVLDVQGAEIEVLRGACNVLSKFKYAIIEIATQSQGYAQTPSEMDITTLLGDKGFRRTISRPSHDKTYADVLFIKASSLNAKVLISVDQILQIGLIVLHFVKRQHLPKSAFYCGKCRE